MRTIARATGTKLCCGNHPKHTLIYMKELCVVSSSSIDHRVDVVNKFSEEREKKSAKQQQPTATTRGDDNGSPYYIHSVQ